MTQSATMHFSILILCILSIYLVVKYMSKHATIIASLLCVVHVTNATTTIVLSSHNDYTNCCDSTISSLNGEWTRTGIHDGYYYYVKDADYLYFHSLHVVWYIGDTLGSNSVQ
eukprot:963360_1